MKYFLGIDGGGTKTAYLLADEKGRCVAKEETTGCSYKEIGIWGAAELLEAGTMQCLLKAGKKKEDLCAVAVGLPCFGEVQNADQSVQEAIEDKFGGVPVYITNDVEVGWAGSLGLRPGINVVAGTGSIAYGQNESGATARSGGWSTFFGDEGSCYWLGRRTMELFSKQADGRVERGPLYQIVMKEFSLCEAIDFIDLMDQHYISNRSKVASLQRLLLCAAKKGDKSAVTLYQEAASELAMMVESIADRLWGQESVPVSYSGGLFHAQEFVLPVLKDRVEKCNKTLAAPMFSPVKGAVLLAMKMRSDMDIIPVTENWKKEKR